MLPKYNLNLDDSLQSCIQQFTMTYPNDYTKYKTFVIHRRRFMQQFIECQFRAPLASTVRSSNRLTFNRLVLLHSQLMLSAYLEKYFNNRSINRGHLSAHSHDLTRFNF